jgi:Protein of unknown function (DUF1552)
MRIMSTRRKFLAGLGLGTASPLLTSIAGNLVGEAIAQTSAARFKHLFMFTGANGMLERFTTCKARGERDFDLGPIYQPVTAYKDRMTLVHRFFVPHTKDLHGSRTSLTTCMASPSPNTKPAAPPGGISIDRHIAKGIGAGDAFSSTIVGRGDSLSSDGSNQRLPIIYAPAPAFAKYFGGALPAPTGGGSPGPGGGFASDFVAKDRSILDWLRADAGRLNARLGAPERAKVDQYLESLRSLERQIGVRSTTQTSCTKPSVPKDTPAACSGQTGTTGCAQAIEQLVDISFVAQQCGLTHVSHLQFEGMGGPHIKYEWLGDPRNHHDDNHANDNAILQKIETWWFSMIGRLLDQLAKAPEGNGTMLDTSLIMFMNTGGGVHHRGFDRHPLILIGGKAGSAGRYLDFPEGRHCMSEAYAAIANAFGVPTEKFGDPKFCPGPLAGLLS